MCPLVSYELYVHVYPQSSWSHTAGNFSRCLALLSLGGGLHSLVTLQFQPIDNHSELT